MSSLRSRLKGLVLRSNTSQTTDEATAIADSNGNTPSTSPVKPKKDELGFLELDPGTDPVVE